MINTLGKDSFAAATFKGLWDTSLWDASFETEYGKLVAHFGPYQSSLPFSRRENQNTVYRK